MKLKILAALTLSLLSLSAHARYFVLDYRDENSRDLELRGNSTVTLKRDLMERYPNFDFRSARLVSVSVDAKSQFGRGQMTLVVSGNALETKTVGGAPFEYNSTEDRTFDYLEYRIGREPTGGVWQLQTIGQLKIRRVVLNVSTSPAPPPPPPPGKVCFFEHADFRGDSFCRSAGDIERNLADIGWANRISSIRVDEGVKARACKSVGNPDEKPDCLNITENVTNLFGFGGGFNDRIQSLKVSR